MFYLVPVGLIKEGSREDADVENDAETVEDTKHGNETNEELFQF